MSREAYKKYFDVLELSPDASLLEIKNAYLRLKKLYSTDSIVMSPIADEFPKKKRKEILKQIEEAHSKLVALLESEYRKLINQAESLVSDNVQVGVRADNVSFSGPALKEIREELGVHLHELALDTKIRLEILQNIELEKFEALPSETYLRGHIRNYASYLFLDPKKVADDYIQRYRAWEKEIKEKS